jgi:hypothetical protein
MSVIPTTIHHHSLRSRLRHSPTRGGESLSLRATRLIADLTNAINQHSPSPDYSRGVTGSVLGVRENALLIGDTEVVETSVSESGGHLRDERYQHS